MTAPLPSPKREDPPGDLPGGPPDPSGRLPFGVPFLIADPPAARRDLTLLRRALAASGVDWSEVHAVRLLGVALGALILFWAIRRMFGGK